MSAEVTVPSLPPCDLCAAAAVATTAAYDAKTVHGPWANMCPVCFERHGVGLGTGRGQRLILRTADGDATSPNAKTDERVTLLAGGDTIYLYAPGDPNIDDMEAVLDVAYPADDVERRTLTVGAWELARPQFDALGVEIVDVRENGREELP